MHQRHIDPCAPHRHHRHHHSLVDVILLTFALLLLATALNARSLPLHSNFSTAQDYELWESVTNGSSVDLMKDSSTDHRCPVPYDPEDINNCHYPLCTSDHNCTSTRQICCFNGCIHTCQNPLPPPAALDWIKDLTNISSLNEISDDNDGFLSCSTTIRNVPALVRGCPDGYDCHVFEPGDPLTGEKNKGMCISTQRQVVDEEEEGKTRSATTQELVFLPGGCLLTAVQYSDLEAFLKGGHFVSCKCEDGSVLCKVSKNNSLLLS